MTLAKRCHSHLVFAHRNRMCHESSPGSSMTEPLSYGKPIDPASTEQHRPGEFVIDSHAECGSSRDVTFQRSVKLRVAGHIHSKEVADLGGKLKPSRDVAFSRGFDVHAHSVGCQNLIGLTPAFTCCRKPERRRSGRWRQSGAALCSTQTQRVTLATVGPPQFLSVCPTHGFPLPLDKAALSQISLRLGHRLFIGDPWDIPQLPYSLLPAAPPTPAVVRRDGL
jgi:hypothetical protein